MDEEKMSDAARGSCVLQNGVGSSLVSSKQYNDKFEIKSAYSRTKSGLRVRTTGSEWDKYGLYLYSRSDTARVVLGTLRTYRKSSMYPEGNTLDGPRVILRIATHEFFALAHSFKRSCTRGPETWRNSSTARFVTLCPSLSWRPSSARR